MVCLFTCIKGHVVPGLQFPFSFSLSLMLRLTGWFRCCQPVFYLMYPLV